MKVIRALGIIYFTAVCAAQTSQDGLPVPSLQLQSTWLEVFPSEEVKFKCDVNGSSDWNFIWLRNKEQIKDADPNLSLSVEQSVLTITAANPTQSGSYTCKGEHKTKGTTTVESDPLQLKVSYPPTPNLKLLTEWLDVFEDETVAFGCELGNSDWIVTWYKNQEKLQEDPSITVDDEGTQLNITLASKAHNGEYACKAELESRVVSSRFSNTKKVTVYDIPKPTLRRTPSFDPMFVGETVNFTCSVDMASGWEYHLQKGEKDPSVTGKVNTFLLTLSDKGRYTCSATRGETLTEDSEEEQLNVLEIPVPSLKKITPWLDVFPDESVQLSCGMDSGSGWTYMWSKAGRTVSPDGVVSFDQSGSILSIKSATATHAGQYTCKGELKGRSVSGNSDTGLTLTVYPEKPSVTLTQVPDYKVMFSGESVTFSCEISVQSPGWEYQWYKDAEPLSASGDKYSVNSINTANTGSYSCRAKRGTQQVFSTDQSLVKQIQVQDNKPKPLMTQQPNVNKVYIGESVSFKCKVEGSTGWRYFWYKNGELQTERDSQDFTDTPSHTSTYKCSATREKTNYSTEYSDEWKLSVSEIPVPFTKLKTSWPDVFPTEKVSLSCGMDSSMEVSSDWTYTWYRDKQKNPSNCATSVEPDGNATLSIGSASASHQGHYTCSATFKSRPGVQSGTSSGLALAVYDKKPEVTLTQNPAYSDMHTGDEVSFSCHVNVSSGWEYLWFKDGSDLKKSEKNFAIKAVKTSKNESYRCQVKRGKDFKSDKSEAKSLHIMERPQAKIILLTGWSEVFSAVSLELKCGVDGNNYMWNYTWLKEGQPIKGSTSEKHTVTPQNDPEQSQYTCKGIREGRPSYSRESEPYKTKNLLLKRRVLLSISGLIFFGIIAVLLGCIALRFFRKPVDDDDGPEEADLFLSMAQQKGAGVPCPLVEYITDSTLTSPSKAGEENGTICSETTPLPISTQEDQAGTTEGSATVETNGGLVSFKQ